MRRHAHAARELVHPDQQGRALGTSPRSKVRGLRHRRRPPRFPGWPLLVDGTPPCRRADRAIVLLQALTAIDAPDGREPRRMRRPETAGTIVEMTTIPDSVRD